MLVKYPCNVVRPRSSQAIAVQHQLGPFYALLNVLQICGASLPSLTIHAVVALPERKLWFERNAHNWLKSLMLGMK